MNGLQFGALASQAAKPDDSTGTGRTPPAAPVVQSAALPPEVTAGLRKFKAARCCRSMGHLLAERSRGVFRQPELPGGHAPTSSSGLSTFSLASVMDDRGSVPLSARSGDRRTGEEAPQAERHGRNRPRLPGGWATVGRWRRSRSRHWKYAEDRTPVGFVISTRVAVSCSASSGISTGPTDQSRRAQVRVTGSTTKSAPGRRRNSSQCQRDHDTSPSE